MICSLLLSTSVSASTSSSVTSVTTTSTSGDSTSASNASNNVATVSAVTYAASPIVNKPLTLNEAKAMAMESSPDVLKGRIDYDRALLDLDQAKDNADRIDADKISSLSSAQTKYVSERQKELAETVAQQAYEIVKLQTAINVEKSYYDVLKAENTLKVKETALKRSQEQLTLVQKKYKTGSAVKTDVNRAEISLANAKNDIANAQRDLKDLQIVFNKTLGVEVKSNWKLTYVLNYQKVTLPSETELSQQALEKRIDIQRARNSYEISKLNYDLIVSWSAPNTYSARSSELEIRSNKLSLSQVEQNVLGDVISTLSQIEKADEVVQTNIRSLQQAKDNQSLAQRRYQIGVGTFTDVLDAEVELGEAEIKYVDSVYSYTLAASKLKTVVLVGN